MAMTESELAAIVGTPIPGGSYTVEPYVDWLLNDVVESPRDGRVAHPLFAYVAVAVGKTVSWDGLFEICGATADDGPMFGEHETVLERPLLVGETFTVGGEFISAERKRGQRTGVFDIVGFRLSLTDVDGATVASTYNSIVFPRRGA
ncbi:MULTISPECIES: hypothetical protein [Prauserella salsuginis group]|uniref:N-terminal of MaoC-like dehydratase domain-containing protein n=1 Tax=Prauserella salsuginis TaxID=387889 RepID=A0ABW6G4T2_9PSEU|nr:MULTISPECIES: hypothetical protein [Prauserella salsuginis group]MCR3718771.1 hypothetical protein [Prauserella flava]MCR3733341.1 hypothetical protein [Prauserella salsuginis]